MEYFIPDIEDIRVGYECESTNNGKNWYNWKFEEHNFQILNLELLNKMYRTPYLTKEQIEAEGWRLIIKGDRNWYRNNKGWGMYYNEETHHMDLNGKFAGECKDINTFRYICKLLKINNEKD